MNIEKELEEAIELIKHAKTRITMESQTSYALGMIRAIRLTYMANPAICNQWAERVDEARIIAEKKMMK